MHSVLGARSPIERCRGDQSASLLCHTKTGRIAQGLLNQSGEIAGAVTPMQMMQALNGWVIAGNEEIRVRAMDCRFDRCGLSDPAKAMRGNGMVQVAERMTQLTDSFDMEANLAECACQTSWEHPGHGCNEEKTRLVGRGGSRFVIAVLHELLA